MVDKKTPPPLAMRPAGMMGRAFGVVMEKMNTPSYRLAAQLIGAQKDDRILEIGFGTGRLLEMLVETTEDISVAGVDPTPTMLDVALAKEGIKQHASRIDLRQGTASSLPWPDETFTAVAALHSFQFWEDPALGLGEVRRVLSSKGRIVLILRDHTNKALEWLPNPLSRAGNEFEATCSLLAASGFIEIEEADRAGSSRSIVACKG